MPRSRKGQNRPRLGRGALLSPIVGASLIVTFAYGASLLQAAPEVVAAAALTYALAEGIVLAIIGSLWAPPRGVGMAIAIAVVTALLATPGRWYLAYLHAGHTAPLTDLLEDLGTTVAWAAFAGAAGATILRRRVSKLVPQR